MNKSLCSLVVLFAATCYMASAGTMVQECGDIFKMMGKQLKEAKDDLPPCAFSFLEENGYFDGNWDFETMKKFGHDLYREAERVKEEGTEAQAKICWEQVQASLKERMEKFGNAIGGAITDGCKDKYQEITNEIGI